MSEKKTVRYNPKLHPHMIYIYRKQGCDQKELAEMLGIEIKQLNGWLKRYPEAKQAYRIEPGEMDRIIQQALMKMVDGYEKKETVETYKKNKDGEEELVERKVTTRHVEGNPAALKLWLEKFLKNNEDDDESADYEDKEFLD